MNSASLQPFISPGSIVSIFGSDLAAPALSAIYDDTASYPTTLGNTTVTFNGVAIHLLYVSPGQINALVPYSLAGQGSVDVVVRHFNQSSAVFTLPLLATSPGVYTSTQTGSGQGAILQLGSDGNYTYNSLDNPAPRGAALEIFATGAGVWNPPTQSDIRLFTTPFTAQPVSVTVGGQPAKILYAGTVGYQEVWALLQVNVMVPDGAASGPQPVVLKIGQNDNSQQNVTVAVQ